MIEGETEREGRILGRDGEGERGRYDCHKAHEKNTKWEPPKV